ncbi:DUF5677 domain-containing protein [Pseudomonadota bacterium]
MPLIPLQIAMKEVANCDKAACCRDAQTSIEPECPLSAKSGHSTIFITVIYSTSMTNIKTDGFLSEEAIEGRAVFLERFKDVFAMAEDMNRIAVKKLGEAKLDSVEDGPFIIYLLTIRIIESYESVIILMERGMLAPAKLIIRPLLEAMFTLIALEKDKTLVAKYFDTQDDAHLKMLRASTKWRDEFLKKAFKDAGLEAKFIKQKEKLKESPPKTLKPFQWAKAADLEDFYDVFYVYYASFTHSNLSALEDHIDREADRLEASFGPSIEGFYGLLRSATAFTLLAVMHMCLAFKLEIDSDAEKIHEAICHLDEKYNSSD